MTEADPEEDRDLSAAFLRIVELCHARDLVPEDGSGVPAGTTLVVESPDREKDWHVLVNTDEEDRRIPLHDDYAPTVPGFHAQVWYGTDLVAPAMMLNPYDGEQLFPGDEFDGRTAEDQFIRDVTTELEERGFDYEPAPADDDLQDDGTSA